MVDLENVLCSDILFIRNYHFNYTKIKHTMINEKKKSLLILNGLQNIRKILTDLKVFLNVTPE